jgi:hypothetical protein
MQEDIESSGDSDVSSGGPENPPNEGEFEEPDSIPEDWEWRGDGEPGGRRGAWHNPGTGESLHDDRTHPPGRDPHWTYIDEDGQRWDLPDDDRENWTQQ